MAVLSCAMKVQWQRYAATNPNPNPNAPMQVVPAKLSSAGKLVFWVFKTFRLVDLKALIRVKVKVIRVKVVSRLRVRVRVRGDVTSQPH